MTILLNLIPLCLFIAAVVYWRWAKDFKGAVVGFFGFMLLYMMLQPSYLPKGRIDRIGVPDFEHSDAEMQDRIRKSEPLKNYENAQQMHEQFMDKH